ncbi:MAG: anion permease [Kofleriaceae bacterium]
MTVAALVLVATAMFIAFANGQNDVSKGIATLVGSGVTSYRRAIVWGSLWTGLGGLAGALLGTAMISTLGRGLLSPDVAPTYAAALATILGAASWVTIATRTSLPVSTTHAIVGALAGVAVLAYGVDGVQWGTVAHKLVLPLVVGPFVALAATAAILTAWRPRASGVRDCACIDPPASIAVAATPSGAARVTMTAPRLIVATSADCAIERPAAVRVTLDHLHWLTSGATSFARGLNDAPKMVALIVAGSLLSGGSIAMSWWFVVVTLAMVAGSLLGGLRVTRVLAEKVTRMDHREGFSANLVTAVLVGLAAYKGLPLSTTHVSTGAILGAGATRKAAIDWNTVRHLMLAWIVTVPAAAILGMIAYVVVRWLA